MKVYRVRNDVSTYQYFLTERDEDVLTLKMDGTSRANKWIPPPVYILQPKLQAGDFYNFSSDILIPSPRASMLLSEHFEMAGELLSLPYKDQEFFVFNVINCIDCLDQESTTWAIDPTTSVRIRPKKYVFHANRFTEARLFKIPETCRGEILVLDRDQGGDEEFRSAIEQAELKGLIFEELWNDNKNE
ncbi:MAG: hypothetical protein GFH27_549297n115 [Chloroflexi bacterium AL-W]|nr:hypothetical protein [Chloroflexi bacterium AL-N1]NOK69031.1 hypothetical protein [Chloroflexi bacterium AL-N10]NOK77014.1 hypothetical protein [Chloroflexi bacterium AL-N5]NOK82598.1 hypothetical protein [Chloroflexi bacterium AL-W]NOK93396.1 hypothetical protein [Chloroflexi bacterium AL-N15]